MRYQDIQDYADEIASARMGFGIVDEVWSDIRKLFNPSVGEVMAINTLANAIIDQECGITVDWDAVTDECQSLMR